MTTLLVVALALVDPALAHDASPGRTALATVDPVVRIALMHLAPRSGDPGANLALIGNAVTRAAQRGADWCVSPELALSGYFFRPRLGLDWVGSATAHSARVRAVADLAREAGVDLFIGMPRRDGDHLHNSVVVIDGAGEVLGAYDKHVVIPGFIEGWATPGDDTGVFTVDGVRVGFLICADLWQAAGAVATAKAGAEIIIAPAAWYPDPLCGPHGTWERDSRLSGLPLLVCNTTGRTRWCDSRRSASAVDDHGRRLFSFRSSGSRVYLVDWHRDTGAFSLAGSFRPVVP